MTNTKPALRRWIAIVGATQLFLALGLMATVVSADTLRISCTGLTVCTAGSTTQVTGSGTPTFNLTNQAGALSGIAFLAVAEPGTVFTGTVMMGASVVTAEESKSFTSGSLGALFTEPGMNDFAFGGFQDASAQVGVTATSFIVSEFNLGAYTSLGGGLPGISLLSAGPLPAGTVIVAWLEVNTTIPGQCSTPPCVNAQTPLSGSLTSGAAVPEPGTLPLFATGLVSVGTLLGTRLFNRSRKEPV